MTSSENSADLKQARDSIAKNVGFFDTNPEYKKYIDEFDVYRYCSMTINQSLNSGVTELLDIGNGGVINYDASKVKHIVALDLFLEENHVSDYPNVRFQKGSALEIPFEDNRFDMVMMQNLLHHVVGKSVHESKKMLCKVISESYRVLKPGGKLLIVESTVPGWFFVFESIVFSLFARINPMKHPATFQYTQEYLKETAKDTGFSLLEYVNVPKGKYVIQFGFKFPSALTPVRVVKLLLLKEENKNL